MPVDEALPQRDAATRQVERMGFRCREARSRSRRRLPKARFAQGVHAADQLSAGWQIAQLFDQFRSSIQQHLHRGAGRRAHAFDVAVVDRCRESFYSLGYQSQFAHEILARVGAIATVIETRRERQRCNDCKHR